LPVRELTETDRARVRALLAGRPFDSIAAASVSIPRNNAPTAHRSPAYYPSALSPSHAIPVAIRAGEERSGLDIRLLNSNATEVRGTLTAVPGAGLGDVVVQAASDETAGSRGTTAAVVTPEGRFRLASLHPGRYVVEAQSRAADGTRWGVVEVDLAGEPSREVSLEITAGGSLSGQVEPSSTGRVPDLRLSLIPTNPVPQSWTRRTLTTATRQGKFDFGSVPPGEYRIAVDSVTAPAGRWSLESVEVEGRDVADWIVNVAPASTLYASVRMTQRSTRVEGFLLGLHDSMSDHSVLVFSADRDFWFWGSRRIAVSAIDESSHYSIDGLPPGDYHLAVVTGLESGEQYDSTLLEELTKAAVRFSLTVGQSLRQDLSRMPASNEAAGLCRDGDRRNPACTSRDRRPGDSSNIRQ
jgi:hypothetical protein